MRVRDEEWKYCGRRHAESIAVPPWIFEVTNRETLFTASRIAKFRILISFRSGATRAKGDLMNSLDLGEMWHGSTVESLLEIDRNLRFRNVQVGPVIGGEKTKWQILWFQMWWNWNYCSKLLVSFIFHLFIKKIEINWNWECYYKFSFKLSEIKFEYNKLEDKNKFKFSN